jgi:hypothetical protein
MKDADDANSASQAVGLQVWHMLALHCHPLLGHRVPAHLP